GAGGALTDSKAVSIKVLSPTEQINQLETMVEALENQGALNQGQGNSLLVKLENAQAAIAPPAPKQPNLKEAYKVIGAFENEVQAMIRNGRLRPEQSDPLLAAAELLLQSLQIGGAF